MSKQKDYSGMTSLEVMKKAAEFLEDSSMSYDAGCHALRVAIAKHQSPTPQADEVKRLEIIEECKVAICELGLADSANAQVMERLAALSHKEEEE